MRVPNGNVVIKVGPYAETKEQLGAIHILHCKDLDEALEFAKKLPASRMGMVEVRPIADA